MFSPNANPGGCFSRRSDQWWLGPWLGAWGKGNNFRRGCRDGRWWWPRRLGSLQRDDLLATVKTSHQSHHILHIDGPQLVLHRQHELALPLQNGLDKIRIRAGLLPGGAVKSGSSGIEVRIVGLPLPVVSWQAKQNVP